MYSLSTYNNNRFYEAAKLKVDPLSDNTPFASPYAYCINNPIILVDPNGREVFLLGELANVAYNQLVNRAQNLNFSFDKKTGKISATTKEGATLTKREQHLLNAINDKDSKVQIQTVKANDNETTVDIGNGLSSNGGSFMGTLLIEEEGKNPKASSLNIVEPNLLANLDITEGGKVGTNLIHEITEGFEACKMTIEKGKAIPPPLFSRRGYNKAHDRATPMSWRTDQQIMMQQYKPVIDKIFKQNNFGKFNF